MYAGIDYLTLWSRSSKAANESFYSQVANWVMSLAIAGRDAKAAALYGTKGVRCQGVYVGIGDEAALLNVPGGLAQTAYCKFYNPSHTVTRIDVQVTSQHGYDSKSPRTPFDAWFKTLDDFVPTRRGRKATTRETGDRSARTVYSGSNNTEILGIIYNKHLQSPDQPDYHNCVRWEVRCRAEWAEMLATRFVLMQSDEITADCADLVASFWLKRGLRVPWYLTHTKLWRTPPVAPYDYERTLKWLTESVAPSIDRLLSYVPLDQVLCAIGLAETLDSVYNQQNDRLLSSIYRQGDQIDGNDTGSVVHLHSEFPGP